METEVKIVISDQALSNLAQGLVLRTKDVTRKYSITIERPTPVVPFDLHRRRVREDLKKGWGLW